MTLLFAGHTSVVKQQIAKSKFRITFPKDVVKDLDESSHLSLYIEHKLFKTQMPFA